MNQKYLPSKKFINRAIIIIVSLIFVYLIVLYKKTYTSLKNPEIITITTTAGAIIERDTDGDGIRDWEEVLWGTDINNTNTFGQSDSEYIKGKKAEMAAKNQLNGEYFEENLNETEKLAREFLATIVALKQSGSLNEFNISNLAKKFSDDYGKKIEIPNRYQITDIKSGPSTIESKKAYYQKIKNALTIAQKNGMGTELSVIAKFYSDESAPSQEIMALSKTYSTLTKTLSEITVPKGAEIFHLDALNESNAMSISLGNVPEIYKNSIIGLIAISQYKNHEANLENATKTLADYFKSNGILK